MEKAVNYEDYWNELEELRKEAKNLDNYLEEECHHQPQEGEKEADWLRDVGFINLVEPFHQGREIPDSELNASISYLSKYQAEAVKRRVRLLNQTIRNGYRQRSRPRKPDIRDVFRDMESSSTGTRSRSATPDSLDDMIEVEDEWPDCSDSRPPVHQESLHQTPSATSSEAPIRSGQEMFRRRGQWNKNGGIQRLDVASNSEGIKLLGYQPIGTISFKNMLPRSRSGSDPAVSLSETNILGLGKSSALELGTCNDPTLNEVTRSHDNIFQATAVEDSNVTPSFENFCQETVPISYIACATAGQFMDIDIISDADYSQLKPLLWLEVSAIFDNFHVEFQKKKMYKRKPKESGNVFGVNLSTLVMRDRRISSDNSTVPQIFQIILEELETRCSREEGILRIAGQKQRTENLCSEIEAHFYTKPQEIRELLRKSMCHELVSVLKRLLRELPQPLLTGELINLFYQTQALPTVENQCQALNLLVLLLPIENRGTLRGLLSFLISVVENQEHNKMTLHNVAMIIAPSLFPPKYMPSVDKDDLNHQVRMAAICCKLAELILQKGLDLWQVPNNLWQQLQQKIKSSTSHKIKSGQGKQMRKKKDLLHRSKTQYDSSPRGFKGLSIVRMS